MVPSTGTAEGVARDVATNEMRREAAKRKLANQQAHRAERARRRKRTATIAAVVTIVVVVVAVIVVYALSGNSSTTTPEAAAPPAAPPGQAICSYPSSEAAAKPNTPPSTDAVPAVGSPKASITTSAGLIGLTLDRAAAPCTVNSFVSLASQKYFDGTPCHRLTTGEGLKVLQCGDPTGSGSGGPGYTIQDEKPTTLADVPGSPGTAVYPRGTVAMAKTAQPNSGGSQFFLVYADSMLPPDYTVFGQIDSAGLATLDKVAQGGSDESNGPGDGKPRTPVTIQQVTLS